MPKDEVAAAHWLTPSLTGSQVPANLPGPAPARILYIEDDLANQKLVRRILAGIGLELLLADDGDQGIELARNERPDAILVDLQLPGLPGEEVVRRLQLDPVTARIPILIATAGRDEAQLERLRNAGVDGFVPKPLDIGDFVRNVRRALSSGSNGNRTSDEP